MKFSEQAYRLMHDKEFVHALQDTGVPAVCNYIKENVPELGSSLLGIFFNIAMEKIGEKLAADYDKANLLEKLEETKSLSQDYLACAFLGMEVMLFCLMQSEQFPEDWAEIIPKKNGSPKRTGASAEEASGLSDEQLDTLRALLSDIFKDDYEEKEAEEK